MENKQKAIQEAYGEHWDLVCKIVDSDGWLFYSNGHLKEYGVEPFGEYEEQNQGGNLTLWRPKSLQGIENNNGWIKIESESDLPSEKIKVWFFTFGEEKIGTFHPLLKEFRTESNIYNYGSVTHYQPIIKPKPPIY